MDVRAILGLGAARNEEEATGLGIPFPPLGERRTLRLVAQYADACNLIHAPPLGRDLILVRRKLDVLREHCSRLGPPYEVIEKTAWRQIALAAKPVT